ncbi:MAG: hypothetical protein BYD32DRAFT_435820 [Podila humilis]|nr:MAG: hypothetical protein BYD32DRAFT_435820 [Podila humilis]
MVLGLVVERGHAEVWKPAFKNSLIAWFIALAILFGVLGATVWKSSQDKSSPGNDGTSGVTQPANNTTTTNTNNGTISINKAPAPESRKKSDWLAGRNKCDSIFDPCKIDCWIADTAFRSCSAKCSSNIFICESECQAVSTCFENYASE